MNNRLADAVSVYLTQGWKVADHSDGQAILTGPTGIRRILRFEGSGTLVDEEEARSAERRQKEAKDAVTARGALALPGTATVEEHGDTLRRIIAIIGLILLVLIVIVTGGSSMSDTNVAEVMRTYIQGLFWLVTLLAGAVILYIWSRS